MSESSHVTASRIDPLDAESTTRARVLQLITTDGPVTAVSLAATLHLTAAGIRRHIGCLEESGLVAVHDGRPTGARGRPARAYVATDLAHTEGTGEYPDIATQALHFLAGVAGAEAIEDFAQARMEELEKRYAPQITAPDVEGRVHQLADALSADGFAASVRPVPGAVTVQLCQGHCPVQHVAAQFPALCDAEAQAFSRLLGSHTQRLVTLANGGHVCTTTIPLASSPPPRSAARPSAYPGAPPSARPGARGAGG